eukprot:1190249-Prorocentrum_minimum.AAC.2
MASTFTVRGVDLPPRTWHIRLHWYDPASPTSNIISRFSASWGDSGDFGTCGAGGETAVLRLHRHGVGLLLGQLDLEKGVGGAGVLDGKEAAHGHAHAHLLQVHCAVLPLRLALGVLAHTLDGPVERRARHLHEGICPEGEPITSQRRIYARRGSQSHHRGGDTSGGGANHKITRNRGGNRETQPRGVERRATLDNEGPV